MTTEDSDKTLHTSAVFDGERYVANASSAEFDICPECRGEGKKEGETWRVCPFCNGTKLVPKTLTK